MRASASDREKARDAQHRLPALCAARSGGGRWLARRFMPCREVAPGYLDPRSSYKVCRWLEGSIKQRGAMVLSFQSRTLPWKYDVQKKQIPAAHVVKYAMELRGRCRCQYLQDLRTEVPVGIGFTVPYHPIPIMCYSTC